MRRFSICDLVDTPFLLHGTDHEWQNVNDARSTSTALRIDPVDLKVEASANAPVRLRVFRLKAKWSQWNSGNHASSTGPCSCERKVLCQEFHRS